MTVPRKRWFELFKLLVAVAILVFIGRQFWRDLASDDIHRVRVKPLWLLASAAVYLVAVGISGLFWIRLMRSLGQPMPIAMGLRAHYVSHMGKYLPGKAWAVWLRGEGAKKSGCSMSVAVATAFYEVLTMMATGALVAAVYFVVRPPPQVFNFKFPPWLAGLILLVACGLPLVPGVLSWITRNLARRFATIEHAHVRVSTLLEGVAIELVGWGLMGLSVWLCLRGTIDPAPELTFETWMSCTAVIGLAYALGFAVFVIPWQIGIREFVLSELLIPLVSTDDPDAARTVLTASALLMRCAWTAAEVMMVGIVTLTIPYRKPAASPPSPGTSVSESPGSTPTEP